MSSFSFLWQGNLDVIESPHEVLLAHALFLNGVPVEDGPGHFDPFLRHFAAFQVLLHGMIVHDDEKVL